MRSTRYGADMGGSRVDHIDEEKADENREQARPNIEGEHLPSEASKAPLIANARDTGNDRRRDKRNDDEVQSIEENSPKDIENGVESDPKNGSLFAGPASKN